MINSLPKLEIISSYSVGLDKIDLARCKEKGIRVTNTPDVLTEDVADLAIGLILATLRGKMRNKVKFSTGLDTFTLMEQKIGEKLVSFMENDYGEGLIPPSSSGQQLSRARHHLYTSFASPASS
ncbi:hypothetical protein HHK36_018077 [Tetracentron sinense]|uniref:D-isomer specific 2-hydroxyacid dehydrogenase catalytic domain-containing protein n=1 Tax=Tetracentron sinense TaxID=13715 RepID=A0A834Z1M6_TETSI|nr:hypothetical protein HHK36_018077 [Tetracentron sinense]